MAKFNRIRASRTVDVDIPADIFFKALLEWDGILAWDNPPLAMRKVALFPGHRNGIAPCTRLVYPDLDRLPDGMTPEMLPEFIPETILHIDEDARMILYQIGGSVFGMRNYFATTAVDDLGDGKARVHCEARLELPDGVPVDVITGLLEETYEKGVIRGTVTVARKLGLAK